MIKVKEKLSKCKEKLVKFCDVLNIHISTANTRKEDLIAELTEFYWDLMQQPLNYFLIVSRTSQLRVKRERGRANHLIKSKSLFESLKKTGRASKNGGETKGTPLFRR